MFSLQRETEISIATVEYGWAAGSWLQMQSATKNLFVVVAAFSMEVSIIGEFNSLSNVLSKYACNTFDMSTLVLTAVKICTGRGFRCLSYVIRLGRDAMTLHWRVWRKWANIECKWCWLSRKTWLCYRRRGRAKELSSQVVPNLEGGFRYRYDSYKDSTCGN